ncbi:signal peptidase II [Microvirga sp. W0021]|uniref:Lipoprotein signal peptidase n=1 Tax=Hohaiivirga grylli TaxID=3133970 RepID=A0ABV0BGD5_9HYPH
MGFSAAARAGFLWAFLTLLADQASKLYLLFIYELPLRYPLMISRMLDLTVEWNRGVSYGMFQQEGEVGRWGLIVISVIAAIGLSIWMGRVKTHLLAVSLGLIVGGAIGNAIDRIAYGAVFDFVYFHVGTFSWYVFNIADAAIVAGVVGLLYDAFVLEKRRAEK